MRRSAVGFDETKNISVKVFLLTRLAPSASRSIFLTATCCPVELMVALYTWSGQRTQFDFII